MKDAKGRKGSKSKEVEVFDMFDRIRPTVEEYLDNWVIIGHRAGCKTKITVGTSHGGWGDMKPIHDAIQEWKKKKYGEA